MNDMVSIDMQEIADGSSCWANGQLQSVRVNPNPGSGYLSEVKSFQSGISLVIQDFSLYGDGEIRLTREEACPPVIGFSTIFSGVRHVSYAKPRVPLGNGCSNIEFTGYESALSMEVKSNAPIQILIVCMDLVVFEKLTGKNSNELVEALDILAYNAGGKRKLDRSKSIDLAQKLCGYQAFASFKNSPHDILFLEAKALELVALQLRQLELLIGKTPKKQAVDHHVEKISHACEILRKEIMSPPKKLELARRVGLNYNQLIQGFKEMFGVCPFEYLRTIRLEKARDLIASHECNITEAAFNVGYSSLSHFSKTFREEFGINPKACA
jgi:AraC-like DNA-binding protein